MPPNYENSCGWVLEHIESYLDDDLSPAELKRFQGHIDGCDSCCRELAFATRVVGELRALPELTAPGRVMDGIAVTPDSGPTLAGRLAAWWTDAWTLMRRPAMATMIVLLLAAGTYVLTQRGAPQQQVSEAEVEEATRETLIAFAYIGKYSRMTGHIIRDEVIDEVVQPVGRAMIETKIIETKSRPGRSDT